MYCGPLIEFSLKSKIEESSSPLYFSSSSPSNSKLSLKKSPDNKIRTEIKKIKKIKL